MSHPGQPPPDSVAGIQAAVRRQQADAAAALDAGLIELLPASSDTPNDPNRLQQERAREQRAARWAERRVKLQSAIDAHEEVPRILLAARYAPYLLPHEGGVVDGSFEDDSLERFRRVHMSRTYGPGQVLPAPGRPADGAGGPVSPDTIKVARWFAHQAGVRRMRPSQRWGSRFATRERVGTQDPAAAPPQGTRQCCAAPWP